MALETSLSTILHSLVESVGTGMTGNWVSTPIPDRLAILAREELIRWTRTMFPSCAIEKEDSDTLRRLALRIYTPRDCHRVDIIGASCGDKVDAGELAPSSWLLVAHHCRGCRGVAPEGLKKVEELRRPVGEGQLVLALWMGPNAPDGCPSCQPVPKDVL